MWKVGVLQRIPIQWWQSLPPWFTFHTSQLLLRPGVWQPLGWRGEREIKSGEMGFHLTSLRAILFSSRSEYTRETEKKKKKSWPLPLLLTPKNECAKNGVKIRNVQISLVSLCMWGKALDLLDFRNLVTAAFSPLWAQRCISPPTMFSGLQDVWSTCRPHSTTPQCTHPAHCLVSPHTAPWVRVCHVSSYEEPKQMETHFPLKKWLVLHTVKLF